MSANITTSLVIPTLNRPDDLRRCLDSITKLATGFDEIIIIEQGDLAITEQLVNQFKDINIRLYFYPIASAAQARNFGIDQAQGKLIFFIDDDAMIGADYVEIALSYFEKNPQVVGLTGAMKLINQGYHSYSLVRLYKQLFLFNGTNFRINRAGNPNNNWFCNQTQNAEWLLGCNMVYRRSVFEQGFRFNQQFIRRSDYEDAMLGYQVFKHYGLGSLVYLPQFTITHFDSEEISVGKDSALKMSRLNHFIFWRQEVYQDSILNLLCFIYNQFGVVIVELFHPIRGKDRFRKIKTFVKIYLYILKHHREIANDQIDYNQFMLAK